MPRTPNTASSTSSSLNSPLITIVAVAAAVVFAALWFMTRSSANAAHEQSTKEIATLTNDLGRATAALDETRRITAQQAAKLEADVEELTSLSNKLETLNAQYTNTAENLKIVTDNFNRAVADAKTFADAASAEFKKRDEAIKGLVEERGELEKRLLTMNTNFGIYEGRLAEQQRKLADAEKLRIAQVAQIEHLEKLRVYWENKFSDTAALKQRTEELQAEQAAAGKQAASNSLLSRINTNLELLPDGSVRLIGPTKR